MYCTRRKDKMSTLAGMLPFEETLMSKAFFSDENMEKIQDQLRYKVRELAGVSIDRQNTTELYIIMRSFYLNWSILKYNPADIKVEIARLNGMILDDIVPRVLSEVQAYAKYLEDIQQIAILGDRGINSKKEIKNRSAADILLN